MKLYIRLFFLFLFITSAVCTQAQTKSAAHEEYIKKYKDIAIKHQQQYKIPASIKLAQGLLESAAGNSRLARLGNNHFGIKCKPEWRGGKMYHDDDEKNECFRTYKSAEDSYIDHSKFLAERKYYVSLFKLDIHDYKGWAHGLQACGYATDKSYGNKLVRVIETYELHKYDRAKPMVHKHIEDDIYEIKLNTDREEDDFPEVNWRRRIHEINGIHCITAQTNDSYEIIAYDTRMKLKKLLKYNEVSKDHKLRKGDIVFLQPKRKYAERGYYTHVVSEGESLYSISQSYGIKLKSLYKLNKLKENYTPKPGDTLRVRK